MQRQVSKMEKTKEKNSEGKTVWFKKEVVEAVEEYRRNQKKIPSFSDAVNTLLKEVLNDMLGKNRKV